jgi:hypothetical protein
VNLVFRNIPYIDPNQNKNSEKANEEATPHETVYEKIRW